MTRTRGNRPRSGAIDLTGSHNNIIFDPHKAASYKIKKVKKLDVILEDQEGSITYQEWIRLKMDFTHDDIWDW